VRAETPPAGAPAGIYVHFPFCAERCTYCDFATLAGKDERIEDYLSALSREIGRFQRDVPADADTVYFGGGTPSRMTPAQISKILAAVRASARTPVRR
jgi:oxygen-independent coproporphyrinogen-3 oxidase